MPFTRSKSAIVDVNIHTNQDTEVSHKVFRSGRDTYAALKIGTGVIIYVDSVDVFDRLLRELVDARSEFAVLMDERDAVAT
jgi:hypothetical protein